MSFQAQLTTSDNDSSVLFPLFPLIVLNSVFQPDLTAITLSINTDNEVDYAILIAVAFNGLPKGNAAQAAASFAKRLNASATSMAPFVTPPSVTIQDISDVRQQTANDGESIVSLLVSSLAGICKQLMSIHGSLRALHDCRWAS